MFWDILKDSALDSLKILPFLFLAFLIMEYCEHRASNKITGFIVKTDKYGGLVGGILGAIPQCGFSVTAANLYAAGMISMGTLVAIMLSTSDEAYIILLGSEAGRAVILKLVSAKLLLAVFSALLVNSVAGKNRKDPHDICKTCGCGEKGYIKAALKHTVRIFIFVLLTNIAIGLAIGYIGQDNFAKIMLKGSLFQPFAAALLGLVPNCASSVALSELYMSGVITSSSLFAGLSANSGVALMVLFRVNRPMKENFLLLAITYGFASVFGFILQFVPFF